MVHFLSPNLNLLLLGLLANFRRFTSISKHSPVHRRSDGVGKNIVLDQVHEQKNYLHLQHHHHHLHHLLSNPHLLHQHRSNLLHHPIRQYQWLDHISSPSRHHLQNKQLNLSEIVLFFVVFLSFRLAFFPFISQFRAGHVIIMSLKPMMEIVSSLFSGADLIRILNHQFSIYEPSNSVFSLSLALFVLSYEFSIPLSSTRVLCLDRMNDFFICLSLSYVFVCFYRPCMLFSFFVCLCLSDDYCYMKKKKKRCKKNQTLQINRH